ncbi:hypothetical protein [Maribacter sp. 2308TA10-17]|uniref:DUF7079 family protein n=1 Tax=Maribacter sp. 2308TA10-17 TaxID=3386276 RepID=UPI0039BD30D5
MEVGKPKVKTKINIEERRPIWIALSDLYIDNELQDYDFKYISQKIKASPYSLEQIKQIDKEEVFPVLHTNLLTVAGIWTGFQEEWLITEIMRKLEKRNFLSRLMNGIMYAFLKSMQKDNWRKIETMLKHD